jgi:Protein of unknown function (DUF2971)
MKLYKYLSPDRICVIRDCTIRFTQYGDFNDPFELNPNIDKIAEESEIRKIVDRDFVQIIEEEYDKNPIISAYISKESFIQLAESQKEHVKNGVLGMEPELVGLIPAMLQKATNSLLGALSLSEIPNHELMWSHYANEHRGYVIGFDSEHQFFNQKKNDTDELRHLRKINYRERPPVINLMKTSGAELFFVKSLKWKYESEWRMLMPLADSSRIIEKQPYPVHLFNFPIGSVTEIIFGERMSVQDKEIIKSLVNDRKYQHIKLCQARLDNASFEIVITPV